MQNEVSHLSRRDWVKLAGIAAAAAVGVGIAAKTAAAVSLFDGKTLDGWIQIENSATSLSSGGITDPAAFAARLTNGADAVSVFLRGRLQDSVKSGSGRVFRIERQCQGRSLRAGEGSEPGHLRTVDL